MVEFEHFWLSQLISLLLETMQDKQQISFTVIRFTVKFSDRLVTTAAPKGLDFQFLKVLGSVRLSRRLCKILVQFLAFVLFSKTPRNLFYITHSRSVRSIFPFLPDFQVLKTTRSPGGGGVLPYLGYTGTCRWIGYGFLASLS